MKKIRKKIISIILTACMLFSLMPQLSLTAAAATNWDGSTTDTSWYTGHESDSSYTITTPEALAGFASLVNGGNSFSGKTVTLGADIVLNMVIDYYQSKRWTPIGTSSNSFQGIFDGGGYTVSGLYIATNDDNTNKENQGLFGYVSGGEIKNVGMVNGHIGMGSGTTYKKGGENIGGLVGKSYGTGAITSCYNAGSINTSRSNYIGGLVGDNQGTITNCYSTGNVSGSSNTSVGGITGTGTGMVTGCYYDKQTSGVSGGINGGDTAGVAVGKTTEWMKNASSTAGIDGDPDPFAGWDTELWGFVSNKYPQLRINLSVWEVSTGGTEAPLNGNLVITFSKSINTTAGGTVSLSDGSTSAELSGGAWSENNRVYTVAYSGLAYETKYTVKISGFADTEGKTMTEDSSYSVTTKLIPRITLSQTDQYTFSDQTVGYSSVSPLTVTVSNIGKLVTGDLTIALSGTGKDSFTLSKTTIGSMALNGTDTFTLAPITGLDAGTYSKTVTVSGNNMTSKSFTVRFTVNDGTWNGASDTSWYTGHESDSTYTITTPEELAGVASLVNNGNNFSGKTITLGASIALNKVSGINSWNTKAPDHSWTPIGSSSHPFKGSFDGCGYTVSGVYISTTTSNQGLFGYVSGGKIKNTGVIDSYISSSTCVGSLVGYIENSTISNCYTTGMVTCVKSEKSYVGGVAGRSVNSTITSCYNTGSINSTDTWDAGNVGGLIGSIDSSTITSCYNTGSVTGKYKTYLCSYNAGGLIGGSYGSSAITNCYNLGGVSNDSHPPQYTGGIVGDNRGTITNCYNTGSVSVSATVHGNGNIVGGIAGYSSGTVTGCYYDKETSGVSGGIACSDSAGAAVGKTTVWMKNATAAAGISEDADTFAGWDTVWSFASSKYPQLRNALYVVRVSPGGTEKAISGNLVITFSKTIDTTAGGTVSLSDGSKSTALSSGSWSKNDTVYTVAYSGLAYETEYTVKISGFTDTEGETMAENDGNSFKTTSRIRLSQIDPYSFTERILNYSAVSPLTVIVSNTSDQVTGNLTVALSGTGKDSFTLSKTTISSIALGGTNTFTVVPKTGLGEGTYSTTVTVTGNNLGSKSFTVQFTVKTNIWDGTSNVSWYTGHESDSSYTINTPAELAGLASLVNSEHNFSGKTVKLGANISLNDVSGVSSWGTTAPSNAWTPIGNGSYTYDSNYNVTYDDTFNGVFDGCGYTVSGIYINKTTDFQGLFGNINGGTIKNVGVVDSYISGGLYDGGLVGYIKNGMITNSYNMVSITGSKYVGGLAGRVINSTIINCHNMGSVTCGGQYDGGLAGDIANSTIANCYNTGSVMSGSQCVGGLFGQSASSTITNCYNLGNNTGLANSAAVGGLVGLSKGDIITNCYNTSRVSGEQYVGGIAGGNGLSTVIGCYYDKETSGINGGINGSDTAGAAVGKTTAWMKNATTTAGISGDADTFAGWDTAVWSFGSAEYPQLRAVPYGISLSQTGLYPFTAQTVGYSSVSPLSITIINIGNQATGNLTVALTGEGKDSFALSKAAVSSIAEGNTDNLTIVPNSNLSAGTYTATVTISGSNVTTQALELSFEVTAAPAVQEIFITTQATKLTYTVGDSLDISDMVVIGLYSDNSRKTETITTANITGFDSSAPAVDQVLTVTVGGKTTTYTVTITAAPDTPSSANVITGFTIGGVDGTIHADHTIAVTLPYGISVMDLAPMITVSDKATVSPTSNTAQDFTDPVTYTVTAENGSTQDYTVTVTISDESTYGIRLSRTTAYSFTGQTAGYSTVTPLSVTVTSTGNHETGALSVALSGDNATSFTLSNGTLNSIAAGSTDSFTVTPNMGLSAGTYTATVTVSGGSVASRIFNVSFTVSSGGNPGGGAPTGGGSNASPSSNITVSTDNNTTTASQSFTSSTGSNGVAVANATSSQISEMLTAAEKKTASNAQTAVNLQVQTASGAKGVSVTLPQSAVAALTSGEANLTVSSSVATVTLDSATLGEISKHTSGDVTITATAADTSALSADTKTAIGTRPVYDLKITSGSTTVSSFGGGTATVSVPYTPAAGENVNAIVVYYINASGELVTVPNCSYNAKTGTVTFTTTHFSTYAVGYNAVSFKDVSDTAWYADSVTYLAARGIVGGNNGAFSPDASITRAKFVTILARMSGDDLSGYKTSSFSDVSTDRWYSAAVQWANKAGIASGYNGKFSPSATITREQMAAMLYRYAQYKGMVSNAEGMSVREFSDYSKISSWAQAPIQWAMNNKILSGNTDGSFAPQSSATRAQAAKMLAVMLQGM